jgi:Ca2+-binding RTX toxin-like protein
VANVLNGGLGSGDTLLYTNSNVGVNVNIGTNVVSGGHAAGDTISGFERVSGSTFNDMLFGSSANNLIAANTGNDSLYGEGGIDTLFGGAGVDYLFGGAAGDVINGDSGVDTVFFYTSATAVTVNLLTGVGSGAGSEALGDTYSNVENATGTNFGDTLTGGTQAAKLDGRGGADTLTGTALADQLIGGTGADSMNGLGGSDLASYTASSAAVQINLNVLTQAGGDAAGDQLTSIENILGSNHADSIIGNTVANILSGNGGADSLRGGTGADALSGGAGSDRFVFANGDSGQTTGFDRVLDYAKGAVGVGDKFDFTTALLIGGSNAIATTTQASINAATGVATFLAGSGTTLTDALADITARMTAATTAAGEFAFFEIGGSGDNYLFISDATNGLSAGDVLVRLSNVTAINTINITAGDVTILS